MFFVFAFVRWRYDDRCRAGNKHILVGRMCARIAGKRYPKCRIPFEHCDAGRVSLFRIIERILREVGDFDPLMRA